MTLNHYLVGGHVRDTLLGLRSKDKDYAVEADSFDHMRSWLLAQGAEIFLETPQYNTIRVRFNGEAVDFVLCRKDGPYSDGRRPDYTEPGTIYDDLARRDFTVNAIAQDPQSGEFIDPHGGLDDLSERILRAVGDPSERLEEDALRAFRALRFAITKNFTIDRDLDYALRTVRILHLMDNVATERIVNELHRMFKHDSIGSMLFLVNSYPMYLGVIESRGIWFEPTVKGK